MTMLNDLTILAPILIVSISAMLILLSVVTPGLKRLTTDSATPFTILTILALLLAGYFLLGDQSNAQALSGAIVRDGITIVFALTTIASAILATTLSISYLYEYSLPHAEFLALLLLSTVGMLIVIMAGDLMTLFIGIETMSLGLYVLTGYRRSSSKSQEAAFKYFIYGAFASAFMIFGIALIYGEIGRLSGHPSLGFTEVAQALIKNDLSAPGAIGIAFILAAFAFKIALVPFHMWTPDVYEGAPTPAVGFMAAGVKVAAFAGLARFIASTMLAKHHATTTTIQIFEILAIITMVSGNLLAIRQNQIKRMLAYSSIAHAGYILVGIVAMVANPKGLGLTSIAYYVLGYMLMTLGAFAIVLVFERHDLQHQELDIYRLSGIAHRYPALALAMALFMLALAGVPPTIGFFGKLTVFAAAVDAGRIAIVVIAVLASAMGAYYYLRIIVIMYMHATPSEEQRLRGAWLSLGIFICAALTLIIGMFPESYLSFARKLLMNWPK